MRYFLTYILKLQMLGWVRVSLAGFPQRQLFQFSNFQFSIFQLFCRRRGQSILYNDKQFEISIQHRQRRNLYRHLLRDYQFRYSTILRSNANYCILIERCISSSYRWLAIMYYLATCKLRNFSTKLSFSLLTIFYSSRVEKERGSKAFI